MTTAFESTTRRAAARPHLRSGLAGLFGLVRQRRDLAALDDHRLRDLGIAPEAARAESRRPFWDAPPHWRR